MGPLGLTSLGVTHFPEVEQPEPRRGSRSRAQLEIRALAAGLAHARSGQPEGTCLSCWKLPGYQRGVNGLGHPVS